MYWLISRCLDVADDLFLNPPLSVSLCLCVSACLCLCVSVCLCVCVSVCLCVCVAGRVFVFHVRCYDSSVAVVVPRSDARMACLAVCSWHG